MYFPSFVSLNHSSCIDHVIVNAALCPLFESKATEIMDSVINHSNYRTIVCRFNMESGLRDVENSVPSQDNRVNRPCYVTRWHKANVGDYYKVSYDYRQIIQVEDDDCFA